MRPPTRPPPTTARNRHSAPATSIPCWHPQRSNDGFRSRNKSHSREADGLKEYTVGLDVFAKPESYDPRQESVVRMHMARVRQKLAEYYRTDGIDDAIIVDLPKGAFKVTFEPR